MKEYHGRHVGMKFERKQQDLTPTKAKKGKKKFGDQYTVGHIEGEECRDCRDMEKVSKR